MAKTLENDILTSIFLLFSFIGSIYGIITIMIVYYKLYREKTFIYATCLVSIINNILKILIKRSRPNLSIIVLDDYSFPSGHSMVGMFVFGYIAYYFYNKNRLISYISIITLICIAFSRIYLRVHYLSDVIMGLILGLICLICYIKKYNK